MPTPVNKLNMAGETAVVSTRMEIRLWVLVDVSIEFMGKMRS